MVAQVTTAQTVYQAVGPGFGGLSLVNCTAFGSPITFSVQAGGGV